MFLSLSSFYFLSLKSIKLYLKKIAHKIRRELSSYPSSATPPVELSQAFAFIQQMFQWALFTYQVPKIQKCVRCGSYLHGLQAGWRPDFINRTRVASPSQVPLLHLYVKPWARIDDARPLHHYALICAKFVKHPVVTYLIENWQTLHFSPSLWG